MKRTPPQRGYGYVVASRFRSKEGLFHVGRIRRTDWLPVGASSDSEQVVRGDDSQDGEFDEQDAEMEHLWEEDDAASETMSTGYDDTFDQELAQIMENELIEEGHGFDSDLGADAGDPERYFPGDDRYECEYEVDHAAFMDLAVGELNGLQG